MDDQTNEHWIGSWKSNWLRVNDPNRFRSQIPALSLLFDGCQIEERGELFRLIRAPIGEEESATEFGSETVFDNELKDDFPLEVIDAAGGRLFQGVLIDGGLSRRVLADAFRLMIPEQDIFIVQMLSFQFLNGKLSGEIAQGGMALRGAPGGYLAADGDPRRLLDLIADKWGDVTTNWED
jgi:hypothetical protein